MRAIDVYSGMGGWSAGLRCAGIEVVEAYEIWPAAVETYNTNLGTKHTPTDVRALNLRHLPKNIQIVVGSPPCTEFSYSNKGGGGNVSEGLKDVVRFFEIVETVKPRYWLMENVPRAAEVIRKGLRKRGHPLYRFRSLNPEIEILDMADFGLPQSRTRCFVGVFPFEILESYKTSAGRKTLGDVTGALAAGADVYDPIWKFKLSRRQLTEMEPEPPLNAEQLRMNREAKRYHPVYNDMAFPDRLDRPSRTITATCTRVSRESIVIAEHRNGPVRRLTVRERASLQGFPITYQFYGKTHSQKIKMIGNAVPPLFSYLAGRAIKNCKYDGEAFAKDASLLPLPKKLPKVTPPHAVGTSYPVKRQFRSVLPTLRFKSGMRFQLVNEHVDNKVQWRIQFFYGPSKDIQTVVLDEKLLNRLRQTPALSKLLDKKSKQLIDVKNFVVGQTADDLQKVWSQHKEGSSPFKLVDALGKAAVALKSDIAILPSSMVAQKVLACCRSGEGPILSEAKLRRNSTAVLAGFLLGSWFNVINWKSASIVAPRRRKTAIA